ncbi:MAG: hypothetical protein ACYSUC_09480 [Planctomycetota bacterium]
MNNLKRASLLLSMVLSGCQFYSAPPPIKYRSYVNPDKDLSTIGRVAIVELANKSDYPAVGEDVTEELFEALQKRQLFSLAVVRQHDPAWRSLQLDLDATYTLEQLSAIRKTLKCNAVLIGTITKFRPHPHMAVGLRLRLIDLRDAQLVWGLEQIWDSADKATEYRIERYFKKQISSGGAALREELVTVSSLKFIKFVAYEVGETL